MNRVDPDDDDLTLAERDLHAKADALHKAEARQWACCGASFLILLTDAGLDALFDWHIVSMVLSLAMGVVLFFFGRALGNVSKSRAAYQHALETHAHELVRTGVEELFARRREVAREV